VTGMMAENYLPAWQNLQMTGMIADNCLLVWQTLKALFCSYSGYL
jgi:hypothetical protein